MRRQQQQQQQQQRQRQQAPTLLLVLPRIRLSLLFIVNAAIVLSQLRMATAFAFAFAFPFPFLLVPSRNSLSMSKQQRHTQQQHRKYPFALYSSSNSPNGDDRDVDSSQFGLEDWRKFRASLIAKEAEAAEASETETQNVTGNTDNGDNSDNGNGKENGNGKDDSSALKDKESKLKRKTVAEENERLLEQQNAELAKEYKKEAWAHLIAEPEVGGLICRMPIEGELYWGTGFWKEKLDTLLSIDTMGPPKSQMEHWFPMAERMLARELEIITANAGKNGILNPNDLPEDSRELLEMYLDYKQTWQEVCLMLGSTQGVVINRPITQNVNKGLAKLLLEGQPTASTAATSSISDKQENEELPFGFIDTFIQAFGQAAVYMGGPDLQAEPALLVHGIDTLEGASELAPGTGIYIGGLKAAVQGVLDGKYQPLDFRFFLGRKVFEDGHSLKAKIDQAAYKAIACNRSLALKQCLGLPKPLWHEVLELCGGDMKSVSQIELAKRLDLR